MPDMLTAADSLGLARRHRCWAAWSARRWAACWGRGVQRVLGNLGFRVFTHLCALQAASLLGGLVGPAVGGLLADRAGLRAPFTLTGAAALLAALYGALRLPETVGLRAEREQHAERAKRAAADAATERASSPVGDAAAAVHAARAQSPTVRAAQHAHSLWC